MKVLLINGSPHKEGCTFTALNEAIKIFKEENIETELIQVGNLDIRGCIACNSCFKTGQCVFNDIVNEVAKKFEEADGIIVGSPVYYASANGTLISFLDRLFYSTRFDKSFKVGASFASARRSGTTATFDIMNKYFTISNMPIASSTYWNNIHGFTADEALQDEEGLATARNLARNMSFLMKSIALGKEKYGLPIKERKITNFIK